MIRKLREEDAAIYRTIRLEALKENPEAYSSSYEENANRPLADFSSQLKNPLCTTFGLYEGEDLVGIATLCQENRIKTQHKGDIYGVYMADRAKGKGYGRKLMEACIDQAKAMGLKQVHLGVSKGNTPAKNLYESLGFSTYGTEPRAISWKGHFVDMVYMVLYLEKPQIQSVIGQQVTVTMDRPMGSKHPTHDFIYPINYGYIEGLMAGDGEDQDAYILGVYEPLEVFTGRVIAVIKRMDDCEDKWVLAPEGMTFSHQQIQALVAFQERFFTSQILM